MKLSAAIRPDRVALFGYAHVPWMATIQHMTDNASLAARSGTLRRNFQGHTTDQSDTLIGMGTAAIGRAHGAPEGWWKHTISALAAMEMDGLLTLSDGQVQMTPKGSPLVRGAGLHATRSRYEP